MRIFKSRWFQRFARKEGIADEALCGAIARAERGLIVLALTETQLEELLKRGELAEVRSL